MLPDLTALGKVMAGGTAGAAYGGRADLMRMVAPDGPVYQAGTLAGNPIATAAGLATLQHLVSNPGLYDQFDRAGETIESRLVKRWRLLDYPGLSVTSEAWSVCSSASRRCRAGTTSILWTRICLLVFSMRRGTVACCSRRRRIEAWFLMEAHLDGTLDLAVEVLAEAIVEAASMRLLAALRREPLDRPPVWMMRQAGRYLPEYRELRSRHSFDVAVRTPAVAAEITLQPVRRFPLDAAIVFADIMTPLSAMGVPIEFDPGPKLAPHRVGQIAALGELQAGRVAHVAETIGLVRGELKPDVAIIGFAGGPVTLLAYLIEGGGSQHFPDFRLAFHTSDPTEALMVLARAMSTYLGAQVEAGANVVQLFDTWAGLLTPAQFRKYAIPAARVALAGLDVPAIYFAPGASHLVELLPEIGAAGYGVDWRLPLDEAWLRMGPEQVDSGQSRPCHPAFRPGGRAFRDCRNPRTRRRSSRPHLQPWPRCPPGHPRRKCRGHGGHRRRSRLTGSVAREDCRRMSAPETLEGWFALPRPSHPRPARVGEPDTSRSREGGGRGH